MLKLFYVPVNDEVDFDQARRICIRLGGQYFTSTTATKLVPRIPPGFIFRREKDAEAFEKSLNSIICDCIITQHSSRMCENGTKGCNVKHLDNIRITKEML